MIDELVDGFIKHRERPLDDTNHIFTIERKGYRTIGYTKEDLEKIAFYFQNRNIISIIITWIKFNFRNKKAYK